MPQMMQYCGQRFQVFKRAGKTCSEVRGPTGVVYVSRRLRDTVHLEHRCDGRAYGGCQAGCLIFWKEAWLKHVGATDSQGHLTRELLPDRASTLNGASCCTEDQILAATTYRGPDDDVRYSCQATQLMDSTTALKWWDARQYVEAYRSGNNSLSTVLKGHCIPALLLRYAGAFATLGRCVALVLRPVPIRLGRSSVPKEARQDCSRPDPSQARSGPKAGRTGAGEIVRADT